LPKILFQKIVIKIKIKRIHHVKRMWTV